MTGLMMKDALVMRKTLRLYALFLLFYSGLAVLGVFPMSMALAMVEVIVMVLPISSFSYDEAAKWDRYAAVLPVGRTAVVKARYLFLLLVLLAAAAIGFVWPFLWGIFLSFHKFTTISKTTFVGLDNYFKVFQDSTFVSAFWFTAKFTVVIIVICSSVSENSDMNVTNSSGARLLTIACVM